MSRNCSQCPSFVPPELVAVVLGKNTAAPMCARFGKVLGNPGLDEAGNARVQEYTALACNAFGQERPPKPEQYDSVVCTTDTSIPLGSTPDTLSTCRGCTNLVRSDVVYDEMGYPVDLCRATGKLVLRPQHECKGCPFANSGANSTTTAGVELLPQFKRGFIVPTEQAVKFVMKKASADVEPSEYPSDKPVSEEDKAAGIRAWRVIEPGDNGIEPSILPVFDRGLFTEEERVLIPSTGDETLADLYVDHQNILFDFASNCYELGEVLALEGEPGTGKTQFTAFAAWIMQMPHVLFAYDSETMVDDMLGKMGIVEEGGASVTQFKPGRITKAIQRPVLITHDEYNMAENSIKEALRTIFGGSAWMTVDRGDEPVRIERHLYNFNVVCQNPAWDIRNIGTKHMGMADMDRLSPVYIDLPPESIERHIIRERCKLVNYDIPESRLDLIMKIATDLREYSKQQTVPFTFGIRQTIKVGLKTKKYTVPAAFKRAVLDFYDPEVGEICMGVINTYMA